MAYTGIQHGGRVDATTERKLNAKIVDNILNSRTYASRLLGMGKPMMGKTYDYSIKIVDSGAGEFFTGLETLSSAASDTLITLSYAHTAFQQPQVSIMVESFANAGPTGTIPLDAFKYDESVAEALQEWGAAVYGTGSGNQPLGLGAIVDDGTDVATIGGQTRATYDPLDANVTASGGGLTLLKMAELYDDCSAAGIANEEPNVGDTTKSIWTFYEQLIQPQVRADYNSVGYPKLALRGNSIVAPGQLKGAAGFNVLSFRGIPMLRDDACTAETLFFLNERYFEWRGRTIVPEEYTDYVEKVSLGEDADTLVGVGADQPSPPANFGWFHQKLQMLPQQAGMIARIYAIGQVTPSQFRRHGKLTGITGVG